MSQNALLFVRIVASVAIYFAGISLARYTLGADFPELHYMFGWLGNALYCGLSVSLGREVDRV